MTQTPDLQLAEFPFAAIVGQAELKLALLLCVIDPSIGGVMVMGHRGTAKSTAVRSLAALLPPMRVVAGCAYGCDPARPAAWCPDCTSASAQHTEQNGHNGSSPASRRRSKPITVPVPLVDLPLGATEDRVVGALDVERLLLDGTQHFAPGLLARAHRGFLYIDEVNLLEDHLVDLLLDVAARGINTVEREGISVQHPARFVLVGSGNPEEGDLRPQLLDRFGLHARITTSSDIAERVEIVRRRRAFDADPCAFGQQWERDQRRLQRRIITAQRRLPTVDLADDAVTAAAQLCTTLEIDGHRGELTLCRAAVAWAALDNQSAATRSDIARVAMLSLRHRLRKDPLETGGDDTRIEQALENIM